MMQISSGGSVSSATMGAWRAQMERNAFKGLDADSNGAIGLDEFKAGLQNVPAGQSGSASPAGTEAAFKAIDTNGDGQLSATELKSAMQARGHHHHRRAAQQDQSQAMSALSGLGGFLMAQLFGQDQPATATTASTTAASASGSGTGQGNAADLAEDVRRLLMRYAATQTATGAQSGLAVAA
jgi:Ca2+-binding EF-hand superfamily protein